MSSCYFILIGDLILHNSCLKHTQLHTRMLKRGITYNLHKKTRKGNFSSDPKKLSFSLECFLSRNVSHVMRAVHAHLDQRADLAPLGGKHGFTGYVSFKVPTMPSKPGFPVVIVALLCQLLGNLAGTEASQDKAILSNPASYF